MGDLAEFTEFISDGIRVRHDALVRFTVTSGKTVLEDRLIAPDTIAGALTVASYTYNRLSVSGGVSWWNPQTGLPIERPKTQMRVRPIDVLTGDELCSCTSCLAIAV